MRVPLWHPRAERSMVPGPCTAWPCSPQRMLTCLHAPGPSLSPGLNRGLCRACHPPGEGGRQLRGPQLMTDEERGRGGEIKIH